MKTIALALLLLLPGVSAPEVYEGSLEPTTAKRDYRTIEFMSAGPSDSLSSRGDTEGLSPATPQERILRVVVYRSEIYQDLVVETLTTGLEGCCIKLVSTGRIDLTSFARHFELKGEISGFVFKGWSSPHSFTFTYKDQSFHATVFDSGAITIERGGR